MDRAAEAAVAIVHAQEPEECVLLIRRSERDEDPWSGHWSLPGGRCNAGETDTVETALRELAEECGVSLDRHALAAGMGTLPAGRTIGRQILVAAHVFRVAAPMPLVLDHREAAEAAWIPLDLIADPSRHRLRTAARMPDDLLFPTVAWSEVPLWGFTYRLLTNWLGLVPPRREAAAEASLAEARRVLADTGLTVAREFDAVSRTAVVCGGPIPAAALLDRLTAPSRGIPMCNAIEVRPEAVRIVGLDTEEYRILAGENKNIGRG